MTAEWEAARRRAAADTALRRERRRALAARNPGRLKVGEVWCGRCGRYVPRPHTHSDR